MGTLKILSVVGARPNFIKMAPLHRAFLAHPGIQPKIVHTGQHYDAAMSDVFFRQLNLPQPDYYLGIQAGNPAQQTADILPKFSEVLTKEKPDWVVVIGDVTSTLACAQAAARHGIRVAHVEAGLRSGDGQMPEERNRILTDDLSELLFVTEQAGVTNLQREGADPGKIHLVGNVLIDALMKQLPAATALNTVGALGVMPKKYVLVTMHRPSNTDTEVGLQRVLQVIDNTARLQPVLFPVHPRTRANLIKFGLMPRLRAVRNVQLLPPQGYLEFLNLTAQAAIVITDSGGIQEETTFLGVPCLTFRTTTERPVTIELGTNHLIPNLEPEMVKKHVFKILEGREKQGQIPPLWDGQTAGRIAAILAGTN